MYTQMNEIVQHRKRYILENPNMFSPEEIEWAKNQPELSTQQEPNEQEILMEVDP